MTRERCDVAVVGAGLVGLTLAYELASLGAAVTVVDARCPGRATDAGAGILSPVTSHDSRCCARGRSSGSVARTTRACSDACRRTASTAPTGYGVCGLLSLGLREHEDEWFGPFAELSMRRSAGAVTEIAPRRRPPCSRPSARCTGRSMPDVGAGRRPGHGRRRGTPPRPAASPSWPASVHGVAAGATSGGRHVTSLEVEGHRNMACDALAVAGGAWTAAMGEWLGQPLPVGPTKGQIVHLGVDAATGEWPIAQPLLTHYLVPWPGGRVACGGTFEAGAGFSVNVTAAGLHELLRECLIVAPGLAGATYGETRVGLRPRRPTTAPWSGGCRVGPTYGWPPATAPTASCRGRIRPASWRTRWPGSRCPPTRCPCRTRSPPPASADLGIPPAPRRGVRLGPC